MTLINDKFVCCAAFIQINKGRLNGKCECQSIWFNSRRLWLSPQRLSLVDQGLCPKPLDSIRVRYMPLSCLISMSFPCFSYKVLKSSINSFIKYPNYDCHPFLFHLNQCCHLYFCTSVVPYNSQGPYKSKRRNFLILLSAFLYIVYSVVAIFADKSLCRQF